MTAPQARYHRFHGVRHDPQSDAYVAAVWDEQGKLVQLRFPTAKQAARAADGSLLWLRREAKRNPLLAPLVPERRELNFLRSSPKTLVELRRDARALRHARSRYRGVWYDTKKGLWGAQVYDPAIRRSRRVRGRYETDTEAARAYDDVARELLGDKAKTNFPEAFR